MAAQRRANVEDVDLLLLQYILEASTGVRTLEAVRKTSRCCIIDIAHRCDLAADTRNALRMPEAHQTSSRDGGAYFHQLCKGRRAATKNAANGYVNRPPRESTFRQSSSNFALTLAT